MRFWQKYDVHHPFLLPNYHGDGKRYHNNFSKIGFKNEHANLISFIELLHVPTVGRNKLHPSDFDESHLARIDNAILYGKAKHIFVSANVLQLMLASKRFSWLPKVNQTKEILPVIFSNNEKSIHKHLHFSNYGKFQLQLEKERGNLACWKSLTPREQEVTALLCMGQRNYQIAETLGIAFGTVKSHLENIFKKFNLGDRHAIRLALRDWDFPTWWKDRHLLPAPYPTISTYR